MPADLHNLQTRKNIGMAKGLLHSLVPRAQSFCFYDIKRECVWSSDGADDSEREPEEDQLHPIVQHHTADVTAVRSERHADSDLGLALGDRVGEHPVYADRGEQKSDDAEHREQ